MKTWHFAAATAVLAGAGCGGSVAGAGGGGTGATGTGAGSTASSSGTGTTTSTSSGTGPTGCPAALPSGSCAGETSGLTCSYGDSVEPQCRTLVACVGGTWTTEHTAGTCTTAEAGACPATQPSTSETCTASDASCVYGDTICICNACAGGLCQVPPVRWSCAVATGPASCPPVVPNAGTACSMPGVSCTYGFPCGGAGTAAQCTGGVWVWGMVACPG